MAELKPPLRFGIVQAGVYRSAAFKPDSYEFVSSLKLKTVVRLSTASSKKITKAFETFLDENSIATITLLSSTTDVLCEEASKRAVETCLDVEFHPLLIMCADGVEMTGTVVGCLRRTQNWALLSAIDEMRNASATRRPTVEAEYAVELFDPSIVSFPASKRLPDWFAQA